MDKIALKSCKSVRRKTRWAMDFDYLTKLSDDEVRYLAEFCNIYYHGSPHRAGEFIKATAVIRKESYSRNNKAQIDLFNQDIRVEITNVANEIDYNIENYIIDFIDNKYI